MAGLSRESRRRHRSAASTRTRSYSFDSALTDEMPTLDISDFYIIAREEVTTTGPRKKLPARLRYQLWERHFTITPNKIVNMLGECYCCAAAINYAASNWHAGHVLAAAHGGGDTMDNLRPVCTSCNLSMGTMPMGEYVRRYGLTGPGAKEFKL